LAEIGSAVETMRSYPEYDGKGNVLASRLGRYSRPPAGNQAVKIQRQSPLDTRLPALGGFTAVYTMPNTQPVMDTNV